MYKVLMSCVDQVRKRQGASDSTRSTGGLKVIILVLVKSNDLLFQIVHNSNKSKMPKQYFIEICISQQLFKSFHKCNMKYMHNILYGQIYILTPTN